VTIIAYFNEKHRNHVRDKVTVYCIIIINFEKKILITNTNSTLITICSFFAVGVENEVEKLLGPTGSRIVCLRYLPFVTRPLTC